MKTKPKCTKTTTIYPIHLKIKMKNDEIGIYQSQYDMNRYGVTDSGEFESNAIKRIPKDNHVKKIKQIFKYKKKLGEGASGKVLLAQEKFGQQQKCALKELHRKQKVNAQLFLREVVILESLTHPNILELYGIYLDKSSYFIATAYYSGGEFFDRVGGAVREPEFPGAVEAFPEGEPGAGAGALDGVEG